MSADDRQPATLPRAADALASLHALPPEPFCRALLPHVSRTFALSVPCLPPPLDLHVTVAYLLCRLADTIEDSPHWTAGDRQRAFAALAAVFDERDLPAGGRAFTRAYGVFAGEAACDLLFSRAGDVFTVLAAFPAPAIDATRRCVCEMIEGMSRTPLARPDQHTARLFRSLDELEQYCHYVAGVVGLMLTRMFDDFLTGVAPNGPCFASPPRLEQGRRFGLGLQMTNILVDQADDARLGKSYIPALDGLPPAQRLPHLLNRARSHLDQALEYSLALPAAPPGLRTFCLLPLFFALRTLRLVEASHAGTLAADRPKITRADVADITLTVNRLLADDRALHDWYTRERRPEPHRA